MTEPHVTSYLDYRVFLRDWIAYQRRLHPGYSYAAFAAAGGCSKAAIANVLSGSRRPRADTLDAFARAMELSPADRNYLGLLAELDAAPDVTRRREVLDRLLSSPRNPNLRKVEAEPHDAVMRYVEHWYIPAIRELAALPGFRADPAWLAATLHPPISVQQAEDALERLFDLGFLCRDAEGDAVTVREVRFTTEQETFALAAHHVHTVILPQLLESLDTARAAQQHLLTATITLAPEQLPEVKQRLNTVLDQVATLADDRVDDAPRAAYQLGLQLLPLSEPV